MPDKSAPFSDEEIERYARHLVLPEIGGPGQQALKAAKVLVVGAGGLGSPVLQYLAAAGVGHLTIVDDDEVSRSNLQRQVLHSTDTIGTAKTQSAVAAIQELNPNVKANGVEARLNADNADQILSGHTLVIDGCDNFTTRYRVADACESLRIPLLTAAVNRFDGSITLLKPWEKTDAGKLSPRYRDLFPTQPEDDHLPSCEEAGVMGATTGLMGCLLALEAIKEIVGIGDNLVGQLLMVDGLSLRFNKISYKRSKK